MQDIATIRREYTRAELTQESVAAEPLEQLSAWLSDAVVSQVHEPTAMTLSTVNDAGRPSSRVVLAKSIDSGIVFFTNYESRKGHDLAAHPFASLVFFWPELERQVRVEGSVEKVPRAVSEAYWISRPFTSRIGATASKQSTTLDSREELERLVDELSIEWVDGNVPLPETWGGYRVVPDYFEFWQGRASRLHDRIAYIGKGQEWGLVRLSP
ncbi:MAG: pyridoxamine 5'-phosphate oxidase [bacterium]|nr:pyridoxamine 5'-phosphate oxidase [bacterium]